MSIAKFEYTSIEEVDPVDAWAIIGAVGGVWRESCLCSVDGLAMVGMFWCYPPQRPMSAANVMTTLVFQARRRRATEKSGHLLERYRAV